MRFLIKIATIVFCSLFSYSSEAQTVDGVTYYLEFDETNCWFDCHIIIDEGWATGIGFRTQFGAQMTFVVPTGSTINVVEKYMPLKNNQYYGGTIPINWSFGVIATDVLGMGFDYYPVSPYLNGSYQYNDLAEGDTIKIFSLEVSGLDACGTDLRFYENGVDPNNINGGDYSNGFTIGGAAQDFAGLEPIIYPTKPTIPYPAIDTQNGISIDLSLDPLSSCQSTMTCTWTGPNGYNSTEEDVLIDPATSPDYGMFKVVVADDMACKDSMDIMVEESIAAVNDLTLSELKINATYEHIAVHADITGDDNKNSIFTIEYRAKGTTTYLPGALTMRATPDMIVLGESLNMNFHAGSAMHLMPNSEYELRITITDVDGGSQVINTSTFTKKFPSQAESDEIIYVIPGSGGGDGSIGNPYQGIQAAVDEAVAGHVIEVADGTYSPFILEESGTENQPIVIRSTNLHGAIIDGSNTNTGVMTLGVFDDSLRHVIIDGFDIKNGKWGIDAQNTQFLTIKNNKISDVDFGIYNRRENGWEHDQYLFNNEIVGRTSWPQTNGEIPGERGIDIRGNRNVVSHNTISDFGDGISTDGMPYKVSYALDIHHNDITRVVDDIIEIDGSISNTRVYKNRGYNGRMGVSVAPVYGGPAYIFRNEFYNLETSAFKMNRDPAGLVIINNSIVKLNRGLTSNAGWQNTIFKNNAVLSGHYVMEEYGLVAGSTDDWNHNGYKSERAGTGAEPWFKWDGVKYNDIDAINASAITEANSIGIEYSDFIDLSIPTAYATEALPGDQNFMLTASSTLKDEGLPFDNILDLDELIGNPDIGAYEVGQAIPNYGHDFNIICERIDLTNRTWNGNINKGWYHPDNWSPCGVPTNVTTVTIPGALVRYPFVNSDVSISNLNILGNGQLELTDGILFKLEEQ